MKQQKTRQHDDKVKMRKDKSSKTTEIIDADMIVSFFGKIDRDKFEYAWGMFVKDLYDDNIREAFREIVQKDL